MIRFKGKATKNASLGHPRAQVSQTCSFSRAPRARTIFRTAEIEHAARGPQKNEGPEDGSADEFPDPGNRARRWGTLKNGGPEDGAADEFPDPGN